MPLTPLGVPVRIKGLDDLQRALAKDEAIPGVTDALVAFPNKLQ